MIYFTKLMEDCILPVPYTLNNGLVDHLIHMMIHSRCATRASCRQKIKLRLKCRKNIHRFSWLEHCHNMWTFVGIITPLPVFGWGPLFDILHRRRYTDQLYIAVLSLAEQIIILYSFNCNSILNYLSIQLY